MSKIFISYAHEDREAADRIARSLAEVGFEPWIDTQALKLGESFIAGMNLGIAKASYLLFLVSESSLSSRWVSMEWMSALSSEETVVLPVILESCELPPLLQHIIYVDLSVDHQKGIAELLNFFKKEFQGATSGPRRTRGKNPPTTLRGQSRRVLRLVALRCTDNATLSSFLFDSELNPSQIAGNSLQERILFLLHLLDAEGLRDDFVDWLMLERNRCVNYQLTEVLNSEQWSSNN